MAYIVRMKKYITILLTLCNLLTISQSNTIKSYDVAMVELINVYRKSNHKNNIEWSDSLYSISKKQIRIVDSTFNMSHSITLRHDTKLLDKYNISEVLAYGSSDTNKRFKSRSNPFINHKLTKNKGDLFLMFIKKYFSDLYSEITLTTKLYADLGNNKYILSNVPYGVYSYNGYGIYVDSVSGDKTYVRSNHKIIDKKIKIHSVSNPSKEIQNKVRIAYTIMQWHYSTEHKNVILSKGREISARNVVNGLFLLSVVNIR